MIFYFLKEEEEEKSANTRETPSLVGTNSPVIRSDRNHSLLQSQCIQGG